MVVQTTVEVRVVRLKIRLLKVSFSGGHDIVVGGRLVSSTRNGKVFAHPDLPAYTHEAFPVPIQDWLDGKAPGVEVTVHTEHGMRPLGSVRANTLLFSERGKKAVAEWIRSQK